MSGETKCWDMVRPNPQTGFGTIGSLEERVSDNMRMKQHPSWWLIEKRKEI